MKEIVVISGKGGTGKTSITASFAYFGGKDAIIADCDVDAADMHLLLQPQQLKSEEFYSGFLAEIDQNKCIKCGRCSEVCRFDSIPIIEGKYIVKPLDCEGCGYCSQICPKDAILMKEQNVGNWLISQIKFGTKMVHANLGIGADNSGKLVAKVKNEAKKLAEKEGKKIILVDGSPGVGCPVVSSLSGASYVVLVTEPSVSGIHDLKRVYELVKKFGIPAGCIINKADINLQKTEEIIKFLAEENIEFLGSISYNEDFTRALTAGKTIVEFDDKIKALLKECWKKLI
ncbi:MAG: (4Fe-4S)-binding protein [Candidatus Cloacimonas sp. SDB]|nr:MAG: (4Fe-4S)-binding protein [Candidatus Cloacimonas sp. SDB]